jgi:uncharacterized membrane protein YkoI
MKKRWIAIIGNSALLIVVAVVGVSFADSNHAEIRNGTIRIQNQTEAQFPSMAKVSMDQAIQKALVSNQGQVLKTELEDENGFLVYGIEVVTADETVMDVKVDAGSGEVLGMHRDKLDREDDESGEHGDRDRED